MTWSEIDLLRMEVKSLRIRNLTLTDALERTVPRLRMYGYLDQAREAEALIEASRGAVPQDVESEG